MPISELLGRVRSLENFRSGPRATDADIAAMEKQLGVSFSTDYREFLSELGFAVWFGGRVFGFDPLGKTKELGFDYDAVRETLLARAEPSARGFRQLLTQGAVIGLYSGGGYILLRGRTEGGDVLLLDMDEPAYPRVWASFEAYLEHISKPRKKSDAANK
jgi:hypothetical protein